MRIGMTWLTGPFPDAQGNTLEKLLDLARAVEEVGLAGFWVTDSFGRGSPKLEALTVLTAGACVTSSIEIGTSIMQLPLRNPVELAHRARTLDILSGGRLRFGIGPGSTPSDFALTGSDFENRRKTFTAALETMQRVWQGEPNHDVVLSPWPGFERSPALFHAAWKSPKAIERAARTSDGWIASGLGSSWEDLERGAALFRAAGGKRIILANVPVDLEGNAAGWAFADHAAISLVCAPQEARDRLARLEALGVDDVLVVLEKPDRRGLERVARLIG